MPIRIDNPLEVGADRLVNAVAAYERIGGACVVVDFGTGINFDAVSADGEYLGGVIAPGVEISLDGAHRARRADRPDRARRRRRPRSASPPAAAIQSGVIFGFAGLIDGDRAPDRGRARRPTDGDRDRRPRATRSPRYCETIDEVDDLLTLTGPAADLGAEPVRLSDEAEPPLTGRALTEPFAIGDVEIPNRVLLAPLAGIGNWFVRLQARATAPGWRSPRWSRASRVAHGNRAHARPRCCASTPTSTRSRSSSSAPTPR